MARKSDAPREEPEPAPSLEPPLSDASAEPSEPAPREDREEKRQEPMQPAAELPPKSFFESVWPQEKNAPAPEPAVEPSPPPPPPPLPPKKPEAKPQVVAVLKSGVVDGMGYTLYVDGSIEAELPQGTVRFSSIHELRSHLEKNG
jgi:hypothetical protein